MSEVLDRESELTGELKSYFSSYKTIPGWFFHTDYVLFCKLDELQKRLGRQGHLLEIGVYQGRSAILLGYLKRSDERLVVCDLFPEDGNHPRGLFESNYLRFHDRLPEIFHGPSTELPDSLTPGTFRFVHIDGAHIYSIVRADLERAKSLLSPGGIVVIDDYANPRFPGNVAATWEEVVKGGLHPLCLTDMKLYASWSPEMIDIVPELQSWAEGHTELRHVPIDLFGRDVPRLHSTIQGPVGFSRKLKSKVKTLARVGRRS